MNRQSDRGMMTHMHECSVLSMLIIDLKKQALGLSHNPITMDRLDLATKAIGSIQSCRKQGLFK